jgi:hypothetical protein
MEISRQGKVSDFEIQIKANTLAKEGNARAFARREKLNVYARQGKRLCRGRQVPFVKQDKCLCKAKQGHAQARLVPFQGTASAFAREGRASDFAR